MLEIFWKQILCKIHMLPHHKSVPTFNMGAGYCDVVVTATSGGVSQIKALAGSTIGGEDLLQNMMHHLLPNSENLFKNHGVKEIKQMGTVNGFAPKYKNLTEAQKVSVIP